MIDHKNFRKAPRSGYRSGANYLTVALFEEMRKSGNEHLTPLYSIGEDDITLEDGTVLPSARLIYINSKGEHDAMSKLVGSFKQWQILKELAWFRERWELWHAEWLMLQGQEAREWLSVHQVSNVSAANTLFKDAKTADGPGRPKKPKKAKHEDSEAYDEDAARVVALRNRG